MGQAIAAAIQAAYWESFCEIWPEIVIFVTIDADRARY